MKNIAFNLYAYFWIVISLLLMAIYYQKKIISRELIKKVIIFWPISAFSQLAINNLIFYFTWKNDRFLRHLLPPESNYLFTNIKIYVFSGYLMTIIIAALVGLIFIIIAKKYQERHLKINEAFLIFFGCLVVGWSNVIVFVLSIFIFAVLGYLILLSIRKIKPEEVLPIATFIFLAIIFTLAWGYNLSYLTKLY